MFCSARSAHAGPRAFDCGYDGAVSRTPAGWDVDSPVQAEVFVVWLDGDRLQLTGPDGPQPWILQLGSTEHPVGVVDRVVRDVVGGRSRLPA